MGPGPGWGPWFLIVLEADRFFFSGTASRWSLGTGEAIYEPRRIFETIKIFVTLQFFDFFKNSSGLVNSLSGAARPPGGRSRKKEKKKIWSGPPPPVILKTMAPSYIKNRGRGRPPLVFSAARYRTFETSTTCCVFHPPPQSPPSR